MTFFFKGQAEPTEHVEERANRDPYRQFCANLFKRGIRPVSHNRT
jgi:hypothetical protein